MSNNTLFGIGNQFIGNSFNVDEHAKIVGENVKRARKRLRPKMSQAKLAKAIGADSQNTIAAIEGGKTRQSGFLPRIAQVLQVKLADLDPQYEGEEIERIPTPQYRSDQPDVKIYASVEAGPDTIIFTNEPVQMTRRAGPLEGVRDAYGVIVHGESMGGVARPGDTVLINPHLPPRPGDLCLFFYEKDGEFRATLKEYRGQTAETWLVKRYHPRDRNYSLKKADLPKCHVVVTVHRR